MKVRLKLVLLFTLVVNLGLLSSAARADLVVLRDGASYRGKLSGIPDGKLSFTDNQGIQYTFPVGDLQSIVFAADADHVTLRDGKEYSGQLGSLTTIGFEGADGISYKFPLRDVSTLLFTGDGKPGAAEHRGRPSLIVPIGTQITLSTDNGIDSSTDSSGQLYPAHVTEDVYDAEGTVAIPAGASAKLVVENTTGGGVGGSPDLVLDLYSVEVNGQEYRVDSSTVKESSRRGLGLNRRTAEFAGGGAGIGALLGAVFGGGRGAGIGAAAGAGGGALTQLFTRGKQVKVPAETALTFRLDRTLVLHR